MSSPVVSAVRLAPDATVWDYLALPEGELEKADVVALDLAVARGIPQFKDLDVGRYIGVVDAWVTEFARRLPASEEFFHQVGPEKWKSDIRFYRVGMLQGFIGQVLGIRYIEEQRHATAAYYTNPGDLFLNGLLDTKRGTCGNMATLHVAMARRMGWPVSLACVDNHKLSRFDDGEVAYNIECAFNEKEGFSSGSDSDYLKKFSLPRKAVECGSDLRRLTAREMIAVFLAHRARHYRDIGRLDLCDTDCALARALFPNYRKLHIMGMFPYIRRGEQLFNPDEVGHSRILSRDLPDMIPPVPLPPPPVSPVIGGVQFVMQPAPKPAKPNPSPQRTMIVPVIRPIP